MRLSSSFITHSTGGENYMVSTGKAGFNGIVKSNDTAAFIVECLKKETSENEIVEKLLAEYSVPDRKIVERDVAGIIEKLRKIGAIVE